MMILVFAVLSIVLFLVFLVYFLGSKDKTNIKKDETEEKPNEEVFADLTPEEVEANKERLKNRFITKATHRKQKDQQRRERAQDDEQEEQIEETEENPMFETEEFKGLSAKKQQKLREKQEKKECNEQQKLAKIQKREKEEQQAKAYQEKRALKEKELEEEEQRLKEEKEKKQKEEYDEWRHLFEVEDKGEKQDDITNNENLLKKFIEHIKVVILEELSAQFSMKTQDVIDRIKALESEGKLKGILDDRGKFIYLTEKEIQGVVDFINQRGRISIFDLAQESNKLIKLEGEEPQEEINIDEINLE